MAFFEQGVSYKYPGDYLPGDNNEITITQAGNANNGGGFSLGNRNIVNISQIGNNDYAGHWLWGNDNKATISQSGNNEDWAYAAANSNNNISVITQVGYKMTVALLRVG